MGLNVRWRDREKLGYQKRNRQKNWEEAKNEVIVSNRDPKWKIVSLSQKQEQGTAKAA
jgi:hypothetical protein